MNMQNFHPLIRKAHEYAKLHHRNVKRNYNDVPYFFHVMQVANILHMLAPNDISLICAGYCHDLMEDTEITYEDIKKEFNEDTADLVLYVTDNKEDYKKYDSKNYRIGKRIYQTDKLSNISDRGVLLKLADIYSNISDCFTTPSEASSWTKDFIEEKKYILDNYYRNNDKGLYFMERQILTSKIYNIIDLYIENKLKV
jgi:GTP pyrophosphokinase